MFGRFSEFFTEEDNRLSMSRLLLFQSFYVASALLFIDTMKHGLNEVLFAGYLAAFAATYVGGKWAGRKNVAQPPAVAPVVIQTGNPATVGGDNAVNS